MSDPSAIVPRILVGAYALCGTGAPVPQDWYTALEIEGVVGLEHPVHADDIGSLVALAAGLPPSWQVLLTTAPMTSARLAASGSYGLASTDQEGRRRAVADVRTCLEAAERLDESAGWRRVVGIELHTAPGPGRGSGEALARSLVELAGTARGTIPLVVEHCDAPGRAGPPDKGYLHLDDELRAVSRATAVTGYPVQLGLNWGRSAIEGRSVITPVEHARQAVSSGLLATAILSGVSVAPGPWGAPWRDSHVPPCGQAPLPPVAGDALLGLREAVTYLAACQEVPVVGVKVAAGSADATVPDRLDLLRASVRFAQLALTRATSSAR